ncbi:glutamate synthase subunit beta [Planctomycetes bacterium Pla163]|uniref:Glutamate synthase subunit beta n=1 Tax=Rohdeia mirabilis TaxID=2528008 RepID=A0A518D0U6_9BACT|nr:glutamate synthase subunit beta [Planctomycetes bacterium Pla163]
MDSSRERAGSGGTVAVVGAGSSGLVCARELARRGRSVVVVDKGRGSGGRLSTRGRGGPAFDHGAQYFTARDPRFVEQTRAWVAAGVAARWEPRLVVLDGGRAEAAAGGTERFVGTPGMRQLAVALGAELVELGAAAPLQGLHVERLESGREGWRLVATDLAASSSAASSDVASSAAAEVVLGPFEAVVVATPAPQAAELVATAGPAWSALARRARAVTMTPCLAALVQFEDALRTPDGERFDAAFVGREGASEGPPAALSWIARDGSKPGRVDADTWVLHAGPRFSAERFDRPAEQWSAELLAELAHLLGRDLPAPTHLDTHRWGYALAPEPLTAGALHADGVGPPLVVAGDWCAGSRVEGAYLSGLAAAARLG